jgi:hypothetical protein
VDWEVADGQRGNIFFDPALDREFLELGFGLINQGVHSLVEAGLIALIAVTFLVEDAIGLVAKTAQSFRQVADLDVAAALNLLKGS